MTIGEKRVIKLALREDMIPGASLADRLSWLEKVGIEGMEVCGRSLELSDDEIVDVFSRSSIEAANVSGATTLLDADPGLRAAGLDLTRRRLKLAARLNARAGVLLVPQFGRQPALPDLSPYKSGRELEQELFSVQLRDLAPAAQAAGVPLFIEPLNRYEAHLVNRLDQAVHFASEAGAGVAIMADFFHMNIEEADIAASIQQAGSQIVYVHVADSNRWQPGKGHLDFRPGFAALKAIGYQGFLGIECRIVGSFEESVRETAAHLRALWDAA